MPYMQRWFRWSLWNMGWFHSLRYYVISWNQNLIMQVLILVLCLISSDETINLTYKELETHGCVLSTVATDALVQKHQAISIHSTE